MLRLGGGVQGLARGVKIETHPFVPQEAHLDRTRGSADLHGEPESARARGERGKIAHGIHHPGGGPEGRPPPSREEDRHGVATKPQDVSPLLLDQVNHAGEVPVQEPGQLLGALLPQDGERFRQGGEPRHVAEEDGPFAAPPGGPPGQGVVDQVGKAPG